VRTSSREIGEARIAIVVGPCSLSVIEIASNHRSNIATSPVELQKLYEAFFHTAIFTVGSRMSSRRKLRVELNVRPES
jgi:hypothetical protein